MFYLTHRPHTIGELDNVKPRELISSLLGSPNLPHALLFVGHKGTGKTSTARIVAKSINCQQRKGIEPCNTCATCKAIDTSSFSDVVEMDAASNRGINEVKELIKESALMPMGGSYRVYIIDEAHMITTDGFNALLKTLEEPPETVVFILATTNLEKVPKTIQSRCVIVQFGTAQEDEIVHMLERIQKAEKTTMSPMAMHIIAQHSDHSFRDAAKLFEELVIAKKTDDNAVRAHIGIRSIDHLYAALTKRDKAKTVDWLNTFNNDGGNIHLLIEDMLSDLQNHLLFLNTIEGTTKNLSFSLKETITLMKLLNESYGLLKLSPIPSIPLQVALLEYCIMVA